jgi:hypothetical protein
MSSQKRNFFERERRDPRNIDDMTRDWRCEEQALNANRAFGKEPSNFAGADTTMM